jgi:hypothetical protein
MSLTDLIRRYVYNPIAKLWRTLTGAPVPDQTVQREIDRLRAAAADTLVGLTADLFAGALELDEWQAAVATTLKLAHLAQAVFARGGRANMGPEEFGRVGGHLADEFRHLMRFAEGIQNGSVTEAQALYRIRMYANATQQSYLREWAIQRRNPAWDGLPRLNQVPRDGKTKCRGNCNCELREGPDGIHWDLNPGESCEDCIALNKGGPYQPGRV